MEGSKLINLTLLLIILILYFLITESLTVSNPNVIVDIFHVVEDIKQSLLTSSSLKAHEILSNSQPFIDQELQTLIDKTQFLINSPLARGSRDLITGIDAFLNSDAIGNFKASDTSIIAKHFLDNTLQEYGRVTLSEFNKIIDENPKFRLSSSEYISDLYNNVLIPKLDDTAAFLDKSPLFTNIKYVAAAPTSEIIGKVSSTIAEKISPVTDTLVGVSSRLSSKVITAVSDLSSTVVISIETSVDSVISEVSPSNAKFTDVSTTSINIPFQLPSINLKNVEETFEAVASNSIPAVARATVSFGEGLERSGNILVTNSLAAIQTTNISIQQPIIAYNNQ